MADNMMVEEVKKKVTVPKYFYEIIVPDMPDYFTHTVDFDVRPFVQCPLHGEDTPSLKYYEETNTYYCFGCRSGGDIIRLHMEYMLKCRGEKIRYHDAVRFLYGYFIEGRDVQISKTPNSTLKKEEELSNNIEISRFTSYIRKLEQALSEDYRLDIENKKKIYETVDTMELLVTMNKVNASEAMQNIKQVVQQLV